MKNKVSKSLISLSCGLIIALMSVVVYAQESTPIKVEFPKGKWTFSAIPATSKQGGVQVYSVLAESNKGLAVTGVGLKNSTPRVVNAVALNWKLVLLNGETSTSLSTNRSEVLGVKINPNEWIVIDYNVVKFTDVSRSLLIDGELTGDYRIEVSVDQVFFDATTELSSNAEIKSVIPVNFNLDDATKQRCKNELNAAGGGSLFIKASFQTVADACQNQICIWTEETREGCWGCTAKTGFGCQANPNCQSCLNSTCS